MASAGKLFAAAGKVVARPLTPEQPFRYDLLLPVQRKPSRVSEHFVELLITKFDELLKL